MPPPYRRSRNGSHPTLTQFVVLSILLHALFILLFGSPAGGSRDGRAMWGSLDVTIRGPLLDSRSDTTADSAPRMQLPGSELLDRRRAARESVRAPAPAPAPVQAPPDPGAARIVDVAPVPPALLETPVAPAATEMVPAPNVERPAPVVAPVPPAMLETPVVPAATELVPAPRVERVAPVVRELPVVSVPTLDFAPRPALDPKLAPPVELPPVPRPPVPVVSAPPMPTAVVPAVTPALAPAVELAAPAPRVAPPAAPAVAPAPPAAATVTPPVSTPAGTSERPAATGSERPVVREHESAPPGGRSPRDPPIFDNRKPPATESPAPGSAPRIDMESARARARELAREGTGNRALLPFPMPPAPERKTKEQLAIEKAWKPDCKDAYKGLGLLAVVPLLANEIGEGNCRW